LIERSFADAAKSSLETSSLAAALASTNPGLLDRGHPKCAHLACAPKS
jgi:hypothetical protein